MVENTVVKEQLTDAMIQAGAHLTRKLDECGMPPSAAFWFFTPEVNEWRLLFAFPEAATLGPRKLYQQIMNASLALGSQAAAAPLTAIGLREPDADLVMSLRKAAGNSSILSPLRVTRNAINGHYIDDALVYRAA